MLVQTGNAVCVAVGVCTRFFDHPQNAAKEVYRSHVAVAGSWADEAGSTSRRRGFAQPQRAHRCEDRLCEQRDEAAHSRLENLSNVVNHCGICGRVQLGGSLCR